MKSLAGHFLVASPHLSDPNFAKTVVLLIHHTEEGALGVVLNRTTEQTVRELWCEVSETPCKFDRLLNLGGPVSGPLMAIHTVPQFSELEIGPGLHFAAQRECLEGLVAVTDATLRLFIGHAGWGGGQLEEEMEQGAWLVAPATPEDVFRDEAEIWRAISNHIGRSFLADALNIHDLPTDPTVN